MKRIFLPHLWLLLTFLLFGCSAKNPVASDDYSNNPFTVQILSDTGQFYWNEFIDPEFSNLPVSKPIQVKIPNYWTSYQLNGKNLPGLGYGSYWFKTILPKNYRQPIGIFVPGVDVAYQLYINGELIYQSGKTGKTKNEEKPEYSPSVIKYNPNSDTLNMVFHLSNFHHRRGGIWKDITIGPYYQVFKAINKDRFFDLFSLGILFSFGIFFLIFSFYYRSEKSIPLLAISFLFISLRGACSNYYPIIYLLPISWEWMIKLEYFGIFGALSAGAWGFFFLFPVKWIRKIYTLLTLCLIPLFVGISTLNVPTFAYSIYIFYAFLVIYITLFTIQLVLLINNRKKLSFLYVLGIFLLIFAAINDTLVANSNDVFFNGYILPRVFLIFIFILSIEFFRRYAETFRKEQALSKELSQMNIILENKVEERTSLLTEKAQIIEKQNTKLQKDIYLKNRILSIIGHDIRSPLASVVTGLDLITETDLPYETREQFIHNVKLSANSLSLLVENLLSWGLSQNGQLRIFPQNNDLCRVINRTIDQFQSISEHKNITIRKVAPEQLVGWFDEGSINIVLRNLVSNALKFTPKGGEITIDASKNDQCITVVVIDSGVGLDKQKMEQIINEKEIISTDGTDNEKGTGLGLFLCKELISLNNGIFSIESEPGKGSWFTFTLSLEHIE
ncbi:MAG TPA: sensor histidine kinase [Prolixibacteraceae bacterium]|nr:sensor histidine kinase [Prolixibacteraceae bacterium]